MTAAAQLVKSRIKRVRGLGRAAGKTGWQDAAWRYYDEVGEIHYAAGFYGHCLARVRLTIERRNSDGEWVEVTERTDPAVEALATLAGPRGSITDLQRAYGEQQFVAGESYLFGHHPQDAGESTWEMLSGVELEVKDGVITRKTGGPEGDVEYTQAPGDQQELAAGEAIAYRLWDPHPRQSGEADAPMRAVLEPCEELLLMGRAVRSRARNRASGPGILFVDDSITEQEPVDVGMDEDAEQQDMFTADLVKTMGLARDDEESAAASVPLVIRMRPEDGVSIKDSVHLLQLTDPNQAYPETEREVHVIRRIGQGLNLPVEVLTGMADANHWSAWQIDEAIWTQHVQAPVERLCGDLGNVYVLPLIGDDDGDTRVWYDAAGLVTKPDRFGDALKAHDALALSDATLRDTGGWDDTDAPSEAELTRRIGVRLNDVGLATGGVAAGPSPGTSGDGGDSGPAATPSTTEKGPPEEAATAGAATAALWRCREAAGARVRTRLQRHPGAVGDVAQVANTDLAHHLGADVLQTLDLDPRRLVEGAASCLVAAGYPEALARRVEAHAARTLFDRTPAPLKGR